MHLTDRIARVPGLPFQKIGDEIIVVAPRERLMHRIDGVGVRAWELLARPQRVEELLDELEGAFEADRAELEADVLAFLGELEERGLIKVGAGSA